MSEKMDYLIAALDFHLSRGLKPRDAWDKALSDYAYVYHADDNRPLIARSAERVLEYLEVDGAL